MMVNFFRGFLGFPFITHCSSARELVLMMMMSSGGLQNVVFLPFSICSSAGNVCMDSMAWGGISPSLCETICLAESERISVTVTCRRESGKGMPSMTHRLWARVAEAKKKMKKRRRTPPPCLSPEGRGVICPVDCGLLFIAVFIFGK